MKRNLFSVFCLTFISLIIQAQSTVTINTTGNRNKRVLVDNVQYTIDNTSATDKNSVAINSLSSGQHTLELVRTNANNRNTSSKSSFNLRDGYDMTITIAANGSISTSETRSVRDGNNNSRGQITTAAYNKMLARVKAKTSSTSRATLLESEFNSLNRKISSAQAAQLIQLVNSESLRFKLAKQSYALVSDPSAFTSVSNLLSSSANRNALASYIATQSEDTDDVDDSQAGTPMSTNRFTSIYNEVIAEPTATDKTYYLNNFFARDNNYYTSTQVRQLVTLVPSDQDRLTLAKAAYRGVTDRANYSLVSQLLSSSYSRAELTSFINNYGSSTSGAMSTTDFDRLYQNTSYLSSTTSRMNAINTAFNTSGNYFTASQARKLIPLVSDDASRLQLAKSAYKVMIDKNNYTELNDILSTSSRNAYYAYVNSGTDVSTGVNMSDADFTKLYNSVNSAWSSTSKFNLVAGAVNPSSNSFSTYQVRQLLSLISSENDRLTLAKNSYDNITDRNNFSLIYDLFPTASFRNNLTAYVGSVDNGTGTVVKTAKTDTEFNSIYRSIQLTFGLGAKNGALTELFNTESNYFTVEQTKQLILQVSSESNRVELIKLAYNNITDIANFNSVYDLLTSQSAKNDVMAYVGSNAVNN